MCERHVSQWHKAKTPSSKTTRKGQHMYRGLSQATALKADNVTSKRNDKKILLQDALNSQN